MGCYSDDLLFIHIPKTAGASCKNYFRQHCHGMRFAEDRDNGLPIGHVPIRDIEAFTGRPLDSFKKIVAVVRNPYEQQLSQWTFWRDRRARGGGHFCDYVAANHATLESFLLDKRNDFYLWYELHEVLGQRLRDPNGATEMARDGIYWYWLSVEDKLPENLTILRQEELDTTFPEAVAQYCGGVHEMRHDNVTDRRRAFQEYYTHLALALVERKFTWAFDNHYERLSNG